MATNMALATRDEGATSIMERVVVLGDLTPLSGPERVRYYMETCKSLGLNVYTKPFEYISLDGKLTFYVTKTATDQLRDIKGVSVRPIRREVNTDAYTYTVEVEAWTPDGRRDFATGVVAIGKEQGDWHDAPNGKRYFKGNGKWELFRGGDRANAEMKAETKAKRRATLSICGLGWMDETELDTVPTARRVKVDFETGEILDTQPIATTVIEGETRPVETVRPQPTSVKAAPPVQVAARDDVTDGDAFPDDIEPPADLPKGVTDFVQVIDTHRMQLGRATYGQAAVLYGVLRSYDPQFNWSYLKDDAQRAAAYRTAMTHVRKGEAQAA